jgi:hypothetical protein
MPTVEQWQADKRKATEHRLAEHRLELGGTRLTDAEKQQILTAVKPPLIAYLDKKDVVFAGADAVHVAALLDLAVTDLGDCPVDLRDWNAALNHLTDAGEVVYLTESEAAP